MKHTLELCAQQGIRKLDDLYIDPDRDDSLIIGGGRYHELHSGLLVPENSIESSGPTVIDLFCGCGGFTCGMMQAGCRVLAGVENDEAAAVTYMTNCGAYPIKIHFVEPADGERLNAYLERSMGLDKKGLKRGGIEAPWTSGSGWVSGTKFLGVPHFFFGDIRKLTGHQILKTLGMKRGEVGAVVGGPPCQGFSTSNVRRNAMDPRNSLVFEFIRLVLEISPKTMVMENVPAMLEMVTPEGLPIIDVICSVLESGDFGVADAVKKSLLHSSGCGAVYRAGKRSEKKEKKTKKAKSRRKPLADEQTSFDF